MRTSAIATSVGMFLIGTYSVVYACNSAKSTDATAVKATKAKTATFYAVSTVTTTAPKAFVIDDKAEVCKTLEAPIAIEVDVPNEAFRISRVIHIRGAAVKSPEATTPVDTVVRTAKVAATLGRALVTTVGAVLGSLADAAAQAKAALV